MKIYARPASPFARKVRVMSREIGIIDQIEMAAEMPKYNPLGKIPALELDTGDVLYDSKVICEYLDMLHDGAKFFPADPAKRWSTLLLQGLADGVGEAVIIATMNKYMRPDEFVYEPAIEFQLEKVERSLADIESRIDVLKGPLTIGPLSTACALGYLDFRFPDFGWRDRHHNLAAWAAEFSERPSMKATYFEMPS